jgi:hypothetical protein
MKKPYQIPLPRYHLPNHAWVPIADANGTDIIRTDGGLALVRWSKTFSWWQEFVPPQGLSNSSKAATTREIRDEIFYLLSVLAYRARREDTEAAQAWSELMRDSVAALNRFAERDKPESLRLLARNWFVWPINKRLEEAKTARESKLFKLLEVGKDYHQTERRPGKTKWKWDHAGSLAQDLISCIEATRTRGISTIDKILLARARRLPPWGRTSAKQWWEVGKAFFLASYPKPSEVPELNQLVTAKTKRLSPGRIDNAVLDLIRVRMLSMPPQAADEAREPIRFGLKSVKNFWPSQEQMARVKAAAWPQ